jgi:signal transduction histidine kinase
MIKFDKLVGTGHLEPNLRHKMNIAYFMIMVGLTFVLALCLYSYISKDWLLTGVYIVTSIIMGLTAWYLHRTRRTESVGAVLCLLAAVVLPPITLSGGLHGGIMYIWFPSIPILFFAAGTRLGTLWVLVSAIGLLTELGLSLTGHLHMSYSPANFIAFLVFFIETAALVILYSREKDKLTTALNRALTVTNHLTAILKEQKAGVEHEVRTRTHQYEEERAKLAASIESLGNGFIIIDHTMHLLSINAAGRRILTQMDKPEDRHDISDFKSIEERLGSHFDLSAHIAKCMKSRIPVEGLDIPFGSHFLSIVITPVIDHEHVIGTVALIEDITDRKALERSRDEFFSIASHELRTPLTAIMGNTSLALRYYEKMSAKEHKDMLGDISSSSKRLITIVNDFLDVSRLEQGKLIFKLEPVNVYELAEEVIHEFVSSKITKSLALSIDQTSSTSPAVQADHDRLKQILSNLVSNAIKYTDSGSVTIALTPIGKRLQIAVTDTGVGIPIESQHLLFRKFQQASNNILTRDNTQSTGLGLYIAKMLAESMQGTLTLRESKPGQSTTFVLELPIVKAASK